MYTKWVSGGSVRPQLAVSPLMELEPCGKNEHVRRYKMHRMIPHFKVSGSLVTPEVISSDPKLRVRFLIDNFATNGRRAAILASLCLPSSGASNGILFVLVRSA